jgi:hypothetical protein
MDILAVKKNHIKELVKEALEEKITKPDAIEFKLIFKIN